MNHTDVLQAATPNDKCATGETEPNGPLRKKALLESDVLAASAQRYLSSTNALNVTKLDICEEFQDPVILKRLRGTIKLHLQGSITQTVKGLLSTISLSVEEVDYMKKATLELQKRIRKLETISRRVEALITESMPPTSNSVASKHNSSTVIIPSPHSLLAEGANLSPTASYVVTESTSVSSTVPSDTSYPQMQQPISPQISQLASNPPATTSLTYPIIPFTPEAPQTIVSVAPLPACDLSNPPFAALPVPVQPPLLLSISVASEGVCLQWELGPKQFSFQPASSYELYSYASSDIDPHFPISSDVWQKVGTVEALPLPMACTLTSVQSDNIYYFAVRSIDHFQRTSEWSNVVDVQVS